MKNKNLNILWIIAFVVLVIAAVSSVAVNGGQYEPDSYSAGALSVMDNYYDFGTISMADGEISYQFIVKNEGDEPVSITKLYTSCMCTTVVPIGADGEKYGVFGMHGNRRPKIEIGVGESMKMEAIFDPAAHGPAGVGLAQRTVYVETNSINSPLLEFNFQAMVTN